MLVAELWVKFLGDATDLQKKTEAARKDIEKFGRDMESVGQRLAVAVSLPLIAGAVAAAKVAGEMEQNAVAFTTLLKSADAAKTHLEALQKFALTTPFQFPELVRSSRLMQAMGFSVGQVIPMMRTLGNAVSAMGGGNEMLQRIILSFGQMQARGKLTGEEIRELAHANVPALALVAAKLGITTAQAMKQMEAGGISAKVAMAAILEYMETRFKGGMEAQAQTMLGMWSNVRDKITFTLADIGKAMLPMAKDVIQNYINPLLDKVRELAGEFEKLNPVVQKSAVVSLSFAAALPAVIWGLGATAASIAAIVKAGPAFWAVFLPLSKLAIPILAIAWALNKVNEEAAKLGKLPITTGNVGVPSATGWYTQAKLAAIQPTRDMSGLNQLQNITSATRAIEDLGRTLEGAATSAEKTAVALDKAWKAVSLKDLRKELTEMEAGYHALRSAGVMSLGDIAEAQKKISDLSREINDRQFGAGIMDLAARAWFKASEGVKAVTDAVFQFMMGGTVYVKKLDEGAEATWNAARASWDYARSLQAAYDAMHFLPISGAPNIQMMEAPDWTKAGRGTTLEAALGTDSAVALRRAASLAGDEWERMVALQKTGARTAVDVKLAYERWVEAEERAVGITNKHKQAMSGFRQMAVSAAREISTAFDDMARSISEIIWPRGGTTEPAWLATQQKAVAALNNAYEGLAGRGYNDPKKALEEIIARIKGAGTAAEANALAIKHFGSAGVEMAAMIRNGTLSTEQFAEALKVATGEMAKLSAETQSKARGIASVFEEVARAVLRSILTIIIEQGLLKLMKVLKLVNSDVKTLEEGFSQLIGKIASAVASWAGFGKKVAESTIPSLPGAISGASTTISGGVNAAGGGAASVGSGASSAAMTGATAWIGAISSAVSAVSGIISNVQNMKMEKTLALIEESTRYAQIHLLALLEKANLTWPNLTDMMGYLWNVQMPYLQKICAAVEAGGAGGSVNNYFTFTITAADPRATVEAIKSYLSTRSPVFA